ncbi:RNA-binding domain-containing protein [Paenibacillus yanchengensis]|uniref:RNA-binding domain-containing protein n=1 Tax=Paenibacillus yanchengensis TaxID=2035833 RepID=A0ABW4YJH7_9BACL
MIDFIMKKVEQSDRNGIIYIHPVASEETISKYISAFSNSEGGCIVFGVKDDGKRLTIRKFAFTINENMVRSFLDEHVEFSIVTFEYSGTTLAYIKVNKSNVEIRSKSVAYIFDKNMEVIELLKTKVFLSYCHNDSCIADIVEQKTLENTNGRVVISRDINKLKFKDSLDEYMQTIKDHDYVISIVSDGYLRSLNCMYEVSELMRDSNYYDKLLFVIMSDKDIEHYDNKEVIVKADVYSINRFDYISFWEDEKRAIDAKVEKIKNPALTLELTEESRRREFITLNVGPFIEKLKDGLGVSFQNMYSTDFTEFASILLNHNNKT